MSSVTRIKQWDFSDDTIFTLEGDATITASVLSMTDPIVELPWPTHWDTEPGYDGNGDAVLAEDVTYKAKTGSNDITMLDGELHIRAKLSDTGSPGWFTYLRGGQANPILAVLSTSGLELEASAPDADFTKFFDNAFREWILRAIDGTATVKVPGVAGRGHTMFGVTDSDAAGTITLKQTDADNPVTLGGGSGGTEDQPYLAYRRTGLCALKAANAWLIPYGVTALGRLTLVADRLGGGTEPLDLPLQYNIDSAASWTDLPADGDLSGVSFTPGKSIFQWRLWHSNGIGMDNANDCRYVPSITAVFLSYEKWYPMPADVFVDDAMEVLETLLTNDETLSALTGYEGAKICQRGHWYPQLQKKAIIYICAITSTAIEMGQKGPHDQAWDWEHSIYLFPTTSEQQADLREALMKADVGLYKFAKLVFDALQLMDLGSTFRFTDISSVVFDPNEVQGPHDNMAMIQITARSKAETR